MATMTEIGETLSTSFLSQVSGTWGKQPMHMLTFLENSTLYWETTNATKGLHKAMAKMKWPQCSKNCSEDEDSGGDSCSDRIASGLKTIRKRQRSSSVPSCTTDLRVRTYANGGSSEMECMAGTSRSPCSTPSGRSKPSPS
jgi:hypothetical protein